MIEACDPGSAQSVAALLLAARRCYGGRLCCAERLGPGSWRPWAFAELLDRAEALAGALIARGLPAGARVALIVDHGPHWFLCWAAIQLAGAVDVPRGTDVTRSDLAHILVSSGARLAFVQGARAAARLAEVAPEVELIPVEAGDGGTALAALCDSGTSQRDKVPERVAAVDPADLHCLIYTSATTGRPKGVRLSHGAMLAQLDAIRRIPLRLGPCDRVLSLLPVWHIFERTVSLHAFSSGASTWFSSARAFADDLAEVQPSFMASAPRVWESLHARLRSRIARAHPLRRALFAAAMAVAGPWRRATRGLLALEPELLPRPGWRRWAKHLRDALLWGALLPLHGLLDSAVLERVRQGLGGCLKGTVSGGGALPPAVDRFLLDLGLPIFEGYGMTEVPVISVRVPSHPVAGTVGPPLPGLELRLCDPEDGRQVWPDAERADGGLGVRGEIELRGPMVTDGYHEDDDATAAAVHEGWWRSGDLGTMGADGCLRIVGRCKDTIVLSGGENVEPGPIEDRLRLSSLIDQVVIVGQDRKHLGALVVPQAEALAERLGRSCSLAELCADPQAAALIRTEIRNLISEAGGFKRFEQVPGLALLGRHLEPDIEITNLFKIRRHVVAERCAAEIATIYGERS